MRAIYPQERHRLPRVAAMLDFLFETFAARPWREPGPAKPKKSGRRGGRRRPFAGDAAVSS
jgi:hypothetical protein